MDRWCSSFLLHSKCNSLIKSFLITDSMGWLGSSWWFALVLPMWLPLNASWSCPQVLYVALSRLVGAGHPRWLPSLVVACTLCPASPGSLSSHSSAHGWLPSSQHGGHSLLDILPGSWLLPQGAFQGTHGMDHCKASGILLTKAWESCSVTSTILCQK